MNYFKVLELIASNFLTVHFNTDLAGVAAVTIIYVPRYSQQYKLVRLGDLICFSENRDDCTEVFTPLNKESELDYAERIVALIKGAQDELQSI